MLGSFLLLYVISIQLSLLSFVSKRLKRVVGKTTNNTKKNKRSSKISSFQDWKRAKRTNFYPKIRVFSRMLMMCTRGGLDISPRFGRALRNLILHFGQR